MSAILTPFVEDLQLPERPASVSPSKLASRLNMSVNDLALVAKVHRNTVRTHPESPRLQEFMRDVLRVVVAAEAITRDRDKAIYWMKNQSLPTFGHQTAFELITEDRARVKDVLGYLNSIESGFVG